MVFSSLPLNLCHVKKRTLIINRLYTFLHSIAITLLIYYRISSIFTLIQSASSPLTPHLLIFISELILSFVWLLNQAFLWRPVTRTVLPERLPGDDQLPAIDVFICTADPEKEPPVGVMNTVVSAMALNYPPDKLSVYLSDDGGCSVTLEAMREAWNFGNLWVPFCRKYGVKTICPEAYFMEKDVENEDVVNNDEFTVEKRKIKEEYEWFVERVTRMIENGSCRLNGDHYSRVEIIHDNQKSGRSDEDNKVKMPLLVYVSREKRPSFPHRFKAGALNALIRVSGILSNAPYMLVLDCDMYCNEPASAKQAMCFHLDSKLSSSLAFVQYPQIFYNISQKDIYDSQTRAAYKTKYRGMDGIGAAACAGTCYYLKKKALYSFPNQQDEYILHTEENFGKSSKFISSLKTSKHEDRFTTTMLEEAKKLASCSYEDNTKWGHEIGYSYDSLLESTFTGYLLHTRGWRSVYLYPKRPCFLGCTTIDMKDVMVQVMKWASGWLQLGFSRFSPLVYGMSRMTILKSMCYAYLTYNPILALAFVFYGTIPQLCLLNGVPLFPTLSNPWFKVFATVYVSSLTQHMYEVLSSGGSITTWWNEQRIFLIRCITALLFGCADGVTKLLGVAKANFRLTNKVVDKEKLQNYENGNFDFEGAKVFMIPLTFMVLLNVVCFLGGMKRIVSNNNLNEMFAQAFLSSMTLMFSYPILKGLVPNGKKSKTN